jgi:TatA/E family protein of Tat protein translocase
MFNIGPLELMIILLLALVVVGPARLPEVGRSIGRALREFRKVQDEVRDSINFNLDAEPVTPRPQKKPGTPPAAVERAKAAAAAAEAKVEDTVPVPAPDTHEDDTSTETIELTADDEGTAGETPAAPASPNGSMPASEHEPE